MSDFSLFPFCHMADFFLSCHLYCTPPANRLADLTGAFWPRSIFHPPDLNTYFGSRRVTDPPLYSCPSQACRSSSVKQKDCCIVEDSNWFDDYQLVYIVDLVSAPVVLFEFLSDQSASDLFSSTFGPSDCWSHCCHTHPRPSRCDPL